MPSVLFVCLGNICRSPAAEGILRHLGEKVAMSDLHVESCAVGDWYTGSLPDPRMQKVAKGRGYSLTSRARPFDPSFFETFDYILAADDDVLEQLHDRAKSPAHRAKIYLMTHFSTVYHNQPVPDPYYKGGDGFEQVMDMLEESCEALLKAIHNPK
jgi:protein-tyrosine phosphatase